MVLNPNLNDLEKGKFFELAGEVAVRTSATGTFSQTGLKNGGRVTEVELNSTTWTALPPSALPNRNAMAVQNTSGIEIKVNYDDSVSGYVGMKIIDGAERFYDITDAIIIYGKSLSGTPIINVEELS